ncbi:protein spire homolog 2-like [Rana temporaria]|uniref:protein spire homolog 2-like n=1 Tax=Rana temporaria TaxID=8407 RepID=UPI001AADE72C|nr:protein spire homolog 2-like [Rana temporaria]
MTDWGSVEPQRKVTLKEILKNSGQVITEEQAWALCYQCSYKCQQIRQVSKPLPVLGGVESIFIHQDGAVSFAQSAGMVGACQSEEKVIEQLGKVVYSALDWGLSNDMERVLSEPLLYLLYRMVGLKATCTSPTGDLWKITLYDVAKVCVERLFLPTDAPGHYKAVCRMQYGVHAEICNLLQTIKQSKQNLKKLGSKEENDSVVFDNWSALWKGVMKELRVGLRLCSKRCSKSQPVEYQLAPYEMLMEDIRCKKYTLRKVQDSDLSSSRSNKSEENVVILDLLRSLKPASERKLKEKPHEEPSLHELLMSEIKSSRSILKSAERKKYFPRVSFDEDLGIADGPFSVPSDGPNYRRRLESRWNVPAFDLQDHQIEGRISWNTELSQESSSEQKFPDLTSSSTELSFLPVWTSSQVDLRMNCGSSQADRQTTSGSTPDKLLSSSVQKKLSFGHKRSSSFEGLLGEAPDEQSQAWDSPRSSLPPTVLELAPLRRLMVKTEVSVFRSSRDVLRQKACSSCRKRLLCRQVLCKFCERTICSECRVEMLMPHQKCMHLPISFFKALVLTQESDLTRNKDLLHWNNSSVPLVMFHPKNASSDFAFRKWIMYNWTSMSICLKCQEYILDVIKRNRSCEIPGGTFKSRSMSVSATPFSRQ